MITTIDDSQNGFRMVLLPNALTAQNTSSQSLWYAIMALSAAHLYGPDSATQYKLSAIRLLSKSIRDGEHGTVSQFATCMMLCVCDVCTFSRAISLTKNDQVFDSVDGSWYIHLVAASRMLSRTRILAGSGQPISFLESWMAYHRVLAEFSHGPGILQHNVTLTLPSETEEKIRVRVATRSPLSLT